MTDKSAREIIHGIAPGKSDAILAALEAGGFAVVPKKPTGEMLVAGGNAQQTSIGSWGEPGVVWSAMLAASNPKEEGSDT